MADSESAQVLLFTDGACSGNPGPGGWAFILRDEKSGQELEDSGGEPETTNNQMELRAVIEGLRRLKRPADVKLYTDSVYVGKGMAEWMRGWKANGWKRKERNKLVEVKNVELWQALDELVQRHNVEYHRVAGHSGHPENERCDQLAVEACQRVKNGRR